MKIPQDKAMVNGVELSSGVDMTLAELQEMAARQQHQIEQQQHVLLAKEQRLKFLKQQKLAEQHKAGENERLRHLRERVEAQENKLRKLRALKNEAVSQVNSNANLVVELESIKTLFYEKEKELSSAVIKVDELSSQLEQLRKSKLNSGAIVAGQDAAALQELEKLHKDLVVRNKLNEEQNSKLAAHHEVLQQRKGEISRLDSRIADLHSRIKRNVSPQENRHDYNRRMANSNIAAVEPFFRSYQKSSRPENEGSPTPQKMVITNAFQSSKRHEDTIYEKETHMMKDCRAIASDDKSNHNETSNQSAEAICQEEVDGDVAMAEVPLQGLPPSYQSVMGLAAEQGSLSNYVDKETHSVPKTVDTTNLSKASSLMSNFAPLPYGSKSRSHLPSSQPKVVTSGDVSSAMSPSSTKHITSTPKTSTPIQFIAMPSIESNNFDPEKQQTSHFRNHPFLETTKPSGFTSFSAENLMVRNSNSSQLTISNDSATTSIQSTVAKPIYASKSVIASTYMRRLGPVALEQYRQNMNQIYQSLNAGLKGDASVKADSTNLGDAPYPSSSLIANVSPTTFSNNSLVSTTDENNAHFSHGEYPPCNIDLVKFRQNASRVHRRRSYSGESPVKNQYQAFSENDTFMKSEDKLGLSNVQEDTPAAFCENDDSHIGISISQLSQKKNPPSVLKIHGTLNNSKHIVRTPNRVSFDPLALLLDASLEGELDLVKETAAEVPDPSCPNDEGITALHNAICAGHYDIVKFLVKFGCNVNAPDSDGWTPLHCAASCNNLPMVQVLVEHGACIFATTISDHETAAEKCEEDEDGFDGCSEYLYNIQEKLGILNDGIVYAVFDYVAQNSDELSFKDANKLIILQKGDESEKEWWWSKKDDHEGYVPRNLLGLYPRTSSRKKMTEDLS